MQKYEEAMGIMNERFNKDNLIAVATKDGERISNRMVNAYFENGAFYIATHGLSNKTKQVEASPEVAVCAIDWFSGRGIGKNLGWVMKPENAELRLKLRKVFEWYDHANDEKDENSIILEIKLTEGMLIKDHHAIRYQIDFINESAKVSEHWGEFK